MRIVGKNQPSGILVVQIRRVIGTDMGILYIYYVRLFAVCLIVNSHFNDSHIDGFTQGGVYGMFGPLGNRIFFVISSYILASTFSKYRGVWVRWAAYRFCFLLFVVVLLKVKFHLLFGGEVDAFALVANVFSSVNFVSGMLVLSVLFPVLYFLNSAWRNVLMAIVLVLVLVFSCTDRYPNVLIFFDYLLVFIVGICMGDGGIRFLPLGNAKAGVVLLFSSCVFYLVSSGLLDVPLFNILSRAAVAFAFVCAMSSVPFGRLPSVCNAFVRDVSKKSLYIYVTHFYVIGFAYELSQLFAVAVALGLCVPICYAQAAVVEPIGNWLRKTIFRIDAGKLQAIEGSR